MNYYVPFTTLSRGVVFFPESALGDAFLSTLSEVEAKLLTPYFFKMGVNNIGQMTDKILLLRVSFIKL